MSNTRSTRPKLTLFFYDNIRAAGSLLRYLFSTTASSSRWWRLFLFVFPSPLFFIICSGDLWLVEKLGLCAGARSSSSSSTITRIFVAGKQKGRVWYFTRSLARVTSAATHAPQAKSPWARLPWPGIALRIITFSYSSCRFLPYGTSFLFRHPSFFLLLSLSRRL